MSRAARNIPTLAEVAALLESGAPQRAERACRALLKREPRNAEAWHLHGIAALQKNDPKEARERIERAIALNADDALYHSNLGVALERLGDLNASHRAHEHALALDPAPADNWFNHGLILLRLGHANEAEASLRTACERAPDDPEFALNLGHARWRGGDPEGALLAYRSAFNLMERPARGRSSSSPATGSLESNIRHALLKALETVFPTEPAPEIRRLLTAELSPELADAAAAQLRAGLPPVASLDDAQAVAEFMRQAATDPLWLGYLENCINREPMLERWLVRARTQCLRDDAEFDERFVAALAVQCFYNEFVWYVGIPEEEQVAAAMERLERALTAPDAPPSASALVPDLLRVSLYRPLLNLEPAEKLLDIGRGDWPHPVANLLEVALRQPLDERRRASELPSLAPVRDATSHLVRGQYEENPYPRWLALPARADIVPDSTSEVELGAALDRRFSDRAAAGHAPRSILAAGAGTGYEALLAARQNPRAMVTLLDLSRTSLAYAARMAARLGLDNVHFVHGDLLDAEKLDERFDIILASGVLHHMAAPDAGLRALARALAPDGSLKLGLYSGAARKFVDEARAWAERAGHEGSSSGIRAFRRDLIERARPEFARLLTSADVHTMSGCRDLVFHVHEHVFDLNEVEALLADAGLRLLGFDPDAGARAAYRQRFPDDPALRSFVHLGEFEREHPEAFAGMYLLWAEPANAARADTSESPLSSTESNIQSTATI